MPIISAISGFLQQVFKYHKKKILVVILSTLAFGVVLFPYDDLGDVITVQVAKLSGNQVFLQFEHLGLDIFPAPGLNLEQVEVATPTLPALKADELTLSPSIAGLLTFKPGFVARAKGFLEGDILLNFKSGDKVEDGVYRQDIELSVGGLELGALKDFIELPVPLKGKANLKTTVVVDPTYRDQPDGEIELNTGRIDLPPSTVPTYYGPLSLPAFQWSQVKLKGRLSGGKLIIENADIGDSKDAFNGQFKGSISINMVNTGAGPTPQFGAYELKMKLNVDKTAQESLSLFLGILDGYKKPNFNGASYAVRISGTRFGENPVIAPLTSF